MGASSTGACAVAFGSVHCAPGGSLRTPSGPFFFGTYPTPRLDAQPGQQLPRLSMERLPPRSQVYAARA